jgi:hypothetical protein
MPTSAPTQEQPVGNDVEQGQVLDQVNLLPYTPEPGEFSYLDATEDRARECMELPSRRREAELKEEIAEHSRSKALEEGYRRLEEEYEAD